MIAESHITETGYNFQPVPQISQFLNEKQMQLPTEQELFAMSLERERRGTTREEQTEYERQGEGALERATIARGRYSSKDL